MYLLHLMRNGIYANISLSDSFLSWGYRSQPYPGRIQIRRWTCTKTDPECQQRLCLQDLVHTAQILSKDHKNQKGHRPIVSFISTPAWWIWSSSRRNSMKYFQCYVHNLTSDMWCSSENWPRLSLDSPRLFSISAHWSLGSCHCRLWLAKLRTLNIQ